MSHKPTIMVLGAGFIGSYLGAHLANKPDLCTVHLIGRQAYFTTLQSAGSLSATSQSRTNVTIPYDKLNLYDSVDAFCTAHPGVHPTYIIVTVKRITAHRAYADIKRWGENPNVTVVTMMNGVRAADEAREFFRRCDVNEGMWPFNVIETETGHFEQASGGDVFVEDSEKGRALAGIFRESGIPTQVSADMHGILYGKLLINLHNAISALTGLPIQQELSTRSARQVWAHCISEALEIYRANGINPVSFLPHVPLSIIPYLLSLPNFLFLRLATRMLSIDPRATSSMYEDLRKGRPTEIEYLQGEIVRMGHECGIAAPVCERVVGLVKDVEGKGGLGKLTGEMILDALELI
ncbi:2-dehydropantoate 2-reductase [Spizellomyces sp. 'palustris']|nr:2-dehydropantoate 2-reductase [Spizellomyces sp. 'palustris']